MYFKTYLITADSYPTCPPLRPVLTPRSTSYLFTLFLPVFTSFPNNYAHNSTSIFSILVSNHVLVSMYYEYLTLLCHHFLYLINIHPINVVTSQFLVKAAVLMIWQWKQCSHWSQIVNYDCVFLVSFFAGVYIVIISSLALFYF